MANRAGHLFDWAHKTPDAVSLVFDGTETTFAALADDVRACAGALASLSIAKDAHVGIWLPACPAFITVQQALFMLGGDSHPDQRALPTRRSGARGIVLRSGLDRHHRRAGRKPWRCRALPADRDRSGSRR
ncbi:AMP-binding protein [Novosphingobium colocasiae]